jgi:hypothetical protein
MSRTRPPVPSRARPGTAIAAASLAVLVTLVAQPTGPAGAGGASWWLERDGYRPGDLVDARSAVSWAHNPQLGQPQEGPYRAYLVRLTESSLDDPRGLAEQAASGTYVGDVEIVLGPIQVGLPGTKVGPNGAILRFVLPELQPGWYSIVHCGTPCRTYLGDLMGGTLTVLEPDGSYPPNPMATTTLPEPVAVPTTSVPLPTLATTSTSTTSTSTSTTTSPAIVAPDDASDPAELAAATGGVAGPTGGPGGATALAGATTVVAAGGVVAWAGHRRRQRRGAGRLDPRPG